MTTPAALVQESIDRLVEGVRLAVREEATNGAAFDVATLKAELKAEILAELPQNDGGSSEASDPITTCLARQQELFADESWCKEINKLIQEAFQGVLPTMIKRFRGEIDKALEESGGTGGAGSAEGLTIETLINSSEMKEMLEDRFRQMLLYLKQDVIPKAIQQ